MAPSRPGHRRMLLPLFLAAACLGSSGHGVEPPPPPTPLAPTTPQAPVSPPPPAVPPAAPVPPPAPVTARPALPVPDEDAQDDARKQIRSIFKDGYARRAPDQRQAFARQLLAQSADTKDDPAARFVLLREAADIASKVADVDTALAAVDLLAKGYAIDAVEEQQRVLASAMTAVATAEQAHSVMEAHLALSDQLVAVDDYAQALKAAQGADAIARRTRDELVCARARAALDAVRDLADQFKAVRAVERDLFGEPVDDAARLVIGRFYCLEKGDWEHGLPFLAAGSDPALKALASAELALADPASAGPLAAQGGDAMLSLGDGWWDYGERQKGAAKERALVRAMGWYRQAYDSLPALAKARVDKRMDEAQKLTKSAARLPPGAVLIAGFDKETLVREGAKLRAIDASGRRHHGLVVGATPVSGPFGVALAFDGVDDHVDFGNPPGLQVMGNMTLAMWINPKAFDVRRNPFGKDYNGEGTMTLEPTGSINYFYGSGGRVPYQAFGSPVLKAGAWTHIAVVRDFKQRSVSWFIDGRRVTSGVTTHASSAATTAPFFIGRGYTNTFCGLIDEVAVWDRALTDAEVLAVQKASANGRN